MSSKEVGIEEGRKRFGDYVTAAQYGKSTIVTRNGRPAAMIVPVPLHIALRDITVDAIDQGNWRDQAVENWIEAAAGGGHGFVILATYDQGDVLAVLAKDEWVGDQVVAGERFTLRIDRPGLVEEGEGEVLGIEPGPYDAAQHPVQPSPYDPPKSAAATAYTATVGEENAAWLSGPKGPTAQYDKSVRITDLGDGKVRIPADAIEILSELDDSADGTVDKENGVLRIYVEGTAFRLTPAEGE